SRLLDERLPEEEEARIIAALEGVRDVRGYHRLHTRRAGSARFAEVDVFVDESMRVADAHEVARRVEGSVKEALDGIEITVHIEPYVEGVRDTSRSPKEEFPEERRTSLLAWS